MDGRVQLVKVNDQKKWIIKSIEKTSEEVAVFRKLHELSPSPENHTVPVEFVECEKTTLAVMPFHALTRGAGIWPTLELIVQWTEEILEVRICSHGAICIC